MEALEYLHIPAGELHRSDLKSFAQSLAKHKLMRHHYVAVISSYHVRGVGLQILASMECASDPKMVPFILERCSH